MFIIGGRAKIRPIFNQLGSIKITFGTIMEPQTIFQYNKGSQPNR